MVYIVLGVSGCGKSTVGRAEAQRLEIPFYEADDFHSEANKQKMAGGHALTDADRKPWLENLASHLGDWNIQGGGVLACSALKQSYRNALVGSLPHGACFIYLRGQRETLTQRLAQRGGHFFDPQLLDDQIDTLEEPVDAMVFDIETALEPLAEQIVQAISKGWT